MSATTGTAKAAAGVLEELRSWLEENWDPDLTLAAWWERLGVAGWAAPTLPPDAFGRGLARSEAVAVHEELARAGVAPAPGGLGLLLAAPTIAAHGTREQIDTYVRDIVTGKKAWCQLFSEPGAGSDLAGLTTRAERDGDEWVVSGQKVWTSVGQLADLGMLLARTDPDVPKHQGITFFALEMRQPGVEVRPLRELTGNALFNEVFLSEAKVRADAVVGEVNGGWAVANTTLAHERAGLGAGGGPVASAALPGQVAGHLGRRAGDVVGAPPARQLARGPRTVTLLADTARRRRRHDDPLVRQGLARLHILSELGRLNAERLKAARARGRDIPGMANIAKLAMSEIVREQRDLGLEVLGPYGTLHAYDAAGQGQLEELTGDRSMAAITSAALYAQAPSIYGGTDQIQRNILAERVLGLPKEPRSDVEVPFSSLPKNA